MITVRDVFNFSEMKNGIVRAGKIGLNRQIHWVHIIDHEDIGGYLEGGEFLLVSGQIWSKNTDDSKYLLKTLLEKQIAGIVFATGRYLAKVPQEALEFGDKHSIPIIEVPFHISFVKVTRSIHEAILTKSQDSLQSVEHIPSRLIEKIKTVDSIVEICRVLSDHLNNYVMITDSQNRVLTKSFPKNVKHIKDSTIIDKLRETLEVIPYSGLHEQTSFFKPNQVTFVPSKKPPYVLFVPLQINENNQFTLWIFDPYRPLDQSHEKIAEYAAVFLKDSILNEKEAMAELTERRLEFLELLLEESVDNLALIENKTREFGLYPVSNWVVGVLRSSIACTNEEKISWRDHCQKWLDEAPKISGFCEIRRNKLIIFVSLNDEVNDYKSKFYNLHYHLQNIARNENLTLIVSRLQQDLSSFQKAYEETRSLFPIVQSKRKSDSIFFTEQLQREKLLYGQLNSEQAQTIQSLVLPIELLSDKENFLYETLRCLAKYGFNREETARMMHIHRNTLRYRIKRLEELLNDDLSSSECQFWIRVALDLEGIAIKSDVK